MRALLFCLTLGAAALGAAILLNAADAFYQQPLFADIQPRPALNATSDEAEAKQAPEEDRLGRGYPLLLVGFSAPEAALAAPKAATNQPNPVATSKAPKPAEVRESSIRVPNAPKIRKPVARPTSALRPALEPGGPIPAFSELFQAAHVGLERLADNVRAVKP